MEDQRASARRSRCVNQRPIVVRGMYSAAISGQLQICANLPYNARSSHHTLKPGEMA
jgi:hypothetical protein